MAVQPRVEWFREETRAMIFSEALEILERIGVFVENAEALELLDGAGARIDTGTNRVLLPAHLVLRALATAPSRIRVYDRTGACAMDMGEDRVHFNPGSAALRVFDYQLGRARTPVTQDLVFFSTLIDALPNYAAQSTGIIPGDVPEGLADRFRLFVALQCSTKPVVTGTFNKTAFDFNGFS